ncbi:hypothetical protein FHS36_004813 [Streptomyces eurocidicus]|uniref:Uncharacterized protein n=1 Tax=Streptomyces eurocidicus TaxID=66423 RepID=A0A7W8BDF3_STREU|nr:hypothetical protein [Streptomyces eurocidicus]
MVERKPVSGAPARPGAGTAPIFRETRKGLVAVWDGSR